jgi:hypothetical protein
MTLKVTRFIGSEFARRREHAPIGTDWFTPTQLRKPGEDALLLSQRKYVIFPVGNPTET